MVALADTLMELRERLASENSALRDAREAFAVVKARAETAAIERAGGEKALGSNAEARERALTIALADDAEYQTVAVRVRECQRRIDAMQAEIDGHIDRRREWEYGIREKLANALLAKGYPLYEDAGTPVKDAPFDVAADTESWRFAVSNQGRSDVDQTLAAAPLAIEPANPNDELFADIPF